MFGNILSHQFLLSGKTASSIQYLKKTFYDMSFCFNKHLNINRFKSSKVKKINKQRIVHISSYI